jgi:hypothetical protein
MHWILRKLRRPLLLTPLACLLAAPGAHAQSTSSVRSLGGYGATATSSMASQGSNSPMIPYAGSFGGFMPYRMAGGASSPVSFSARGSSMLESGRTSLRLSPISRGMGMGVGPSNELFAPLGSAGAMRFGGGLMNQPMGGDSKTSVMPPNFGYPFYQPPSLFAPVSPTSGMSM